MKKMENHPILGEIENDRYNNGITYHKSWDTSENRRWNELLHNRYLERPYCSSDCPLAWSKEVYELLDMLDRKFGIEYNTSSIRGYNFKGSPLRWFVLDPLKSITVAHIEYLMCKSISQENQWLVKHWPKSLVDRLKAFPKRFFDSVISLPNYTVQALRKTKVAYINRILNRVLRKQIQLSQVKEKFGSLTIYFSSPNYLDEYIDDEIRRTEVKLALKGAYHPLESFWNSYNGWATGTKHHPDVITTESKGGTSYVKKTVYRNILKEMLPEEQFHKLTHLKDADEEA
jgi:hypothetical protein